jgi:hypothetical protein
MSGRAWVCIAVLLVVELVVAWYVFPAIAR